MCKSCVYADAINQLPEAICVRLIQGIFGGAVGVVSFRLAFGNSSNSRSSSSVVRSAT